MPQPPQPPLSQPQSEPESWFRRLAAMPGRTKLLIAVGGLLAIIFLTDNCTGVDITKEQAVATARRALESEPGAFTPKREEARFLRQGFPPRPMWVVVFTVRDPDGGPEDFLHRAEVHVDAGSGEVRDIKVRDSSDSSDG